MSKEPKKLSREVIKQEPILSQYYDDVERRGEGDILEAIPEHKEETLSRNACSNLRSRTFLLSKPCGNKDMSILLLAQTD